MTIRYASQKDEFRCGPYALLNALKWAGWNYSERRHKKYLTKLLHCEDGTPPIDMFLGLIKLQNKFPTVIYDKEVTARKLNKHLKSGGGAIVNIHYYKRDKQEWNGHWVFLEKAYKGRYKAINYGRRGTVSLVKRRRLIREIYNSIKIDDHVSCFLLEKYK